jgi:hypothetical protein
MRRLVYLARLAALVILLTFSGAAQDKRPAADESELKVLRTEIELLRTEVATLRSQMIRLELEHRRDSVRKTHIELQAVRSELGQLAERDRLREQDVRDLDSLLTHNDTDRGRQLDVQEARQHLAVHRARKLDMETEAARVRESELLRRLQQEEQAVERLNQALKVPQE